VRRLSVRGAALVALLFTPRLGWAQSVAGQVGIDAQVIGQAITVTSLQDLNFGTVLKGVPTTVLPSNAAAGAWQVQGDKNAQVTIAFTLPTVLTNIQALPGSTMPITFGAASALWNRGINSVVGATPFDPGSGTTGRIGPPPNPFIYVWIGGTVTPAATAKPGIYTGTIIVTVAYL
jgi:spore coat protein U-like protein